MIIDGAEAFCVRPATLDDVADVVALTNACTLRQEGVALASEQTERALWQRPGFDLANDTLLVHTPDGVLVGYGGISTVAPHVFYWAWGRVSPDCRSQGIGARLLRWSERRARQSLPLAPPGTRVVLRRECFAGDGAAARLLAGHGYTAIRHSWHMVIDLHDDLPAPQWPEGITVRAYVPGQDDRAVFRADGEAFQDHFGYVARPEDVAFARFIHWRDSLRNFDPGLWLLAVTGSGADEEIVGVALSEPPQRDPATVYIASFGVRRPWRRRGVGQALLRASFLAFRQRGWARAWLHVDASNLTGATRLYEKVGMRVARAYQMYEKELRPGEDITNTGT
ncbi:MAG: GNAT family N-acetyltransferase [Anaerolineae bacterium]|nr:GNAT family N-acetyltransferase [Anaerolineae bacterium]